MDWISEVVTPAPVLPMTCSEDEDFSSYERCGAMHSDVVATCNGVCQRVRHASHTKHQCSACSQFW